MSDTAIEGTSGVSATQTAPLILDGTAAVIDPLDLVFVRQGAVVGTNPAMDELVYFDPGTSLYVHLYGHTVGGVFEASWLSYLTSYTPGIVFFSQLAVHTVWLGS